MPLVFTILKDNVKKKHTEGKVTDVFGERGLKLRLAIAIQLSEQSISWVTRC
jgi:nucleoside diphosphate kinase